MVKEQGNVGSGSGFAEVNLISNPNFGQSVDLNRTALHYPLDIFDRGV